jgi:hypothetical protein
MANRLMESVSDQGLGANGRIMTVKVDLTAELEERLRLEAERHGVPEDECIVRLLDAHLPSASRRGHAVALLQSWLDGKDADDQRETGDYLVRVLDEDRLSERKLFPPELKSQTW